MTDRPKEASHRVPAALSPITAPEGVSTGRIGEQHRRCHTCVTLGRPKGLGYRKQHVWSSWWACRRCCLTRTAWEAAWLLAGWHQVAAERKDVHARIRCVRCVCAVVDMA